MLSQSQARNHINGRRPIGLQASLYEQSPWLERVRSSIWKGSNRTKANAPQSLIPTPVPDNASDPHESHYIGTATEEADLPAASATPAPPAGSSNAPQPGNALDAEESSEMLTEEAASSRITLAFTCVEEMVRRRWADIGRNLETIMEDAEEDAHDGPSIDDEEEGYSADETDMWNLMAPNEGISLEDKMGEHFMRELGNSLSYR